MTAFGSSSLALKKLLLFFTSAITSLLLIQLGSIRGVHKGIIKYIFPYERIRYFILLAINTHIDCANNSKCSERYIFKATKQGALKMPLSIFY